MSDQRPQQEPRKKGKISDKETKAAEQDGSGNDYKQAARVIP